MKWFIIIIICRILFKLVVKCEKNNRVFTKEVRGMKKEAILYFCNSYLLMLNYYESLDEVISDFLGKETEENVENLKDECRSILKLSGDEKDSELKEIISKIKYLNLSVLELDDILETIVSKL